MILPHLTAVSAEQARRFETFVRNGNTLLVTGLTGLFDPQASAWPLGRSPLETVLGGRMKEVRLVDETASLKLDEPPLVLPLHLWQTEIEPLGATVIGRDGNRAIATRHRLGKGEAIWIPSLVALGSWLSDREPFTRLLADATRTFREELSATAVTFAGRQPGTVLRVQRSGTRLVAVVTNGEATAKTVRLATAHEAMPGVIYGEPGAVSGRAGEATVTLGPRGTVVLLWE